MIIRKLLVITVSALALAACGGNAAPSAPASSSAAPSSPAPAKPAASGAASASAKPAVSSAASAAAKPAVSSAAAAASAKPAASGASSAAAKPAASGGQVVKIGNSSASPSNGGEYVASGMGYFQKQGITVEHITFNAASAVAPALATGQVDVADVGVNPAMFNTMAASLGAKVVADKGSVPPGFGFASVLVRKDLADKVKGPADLKGLNVAMTPPGLGTSAGYALSQWLATANLTANDMHIQPIAFPEQPAALSNKAVDVAMMAEPFATQAANGGIGVRITSWDKMVPNQQVAGFAYSAKFIQNRDVATKWMVAYEQGIRTYLDAFKKDKNKDEVIKIMAAETPIKDTKLWSEMIPAGLDPDAKLNVKSIQDQEDFFKKLSLVQADTPPPTTFIDESFAQAAAKQLGPYS
jgi:NitT/TauT family transport system substrate-binding protein